MAVAKLLGSDKSFRELIMELGSIDNVLVSYVWRKTDLWELAGSSNLLSAHAPAR